MKQSSFILFVFAFGFFNILVSANANISALQTVPSQRVVIIDKARHDSIQYSASLLKKIHSQKIRGFSFLQNGEAAELIATVNSHGIASAQYNNSNNPLDTHLKQKRSQINLAYDYKPVTPAPVGFAVAGAWLGTGWSGVAEYFNDVNWARANLC